MDLTGSHIELNKLIFGLMSEASLIEVLAFEAFNEAWWNAHQSFLTIRSTLAG